MRYSIGLDIGITSVGYAIVMLNDKDEPCRIVKLGSRIFEAAEHPKDGSSLAAPRREFRGSRRRLRRKRFRKEQIKQLICNCFNVNNDYIDNIYADLKNADDIYEVRFNALERRIDKDDFIRLLIHLSQRRGFKSNRKTDALNKKSEAGALLSAVEENKNLLKEKGYRTIGEMLFKDEKFALCKRNKSENYSNTFSRQDYVDEIKYIFESQRSFDNCYASKEFEDKYLNVYTSQRSFDEGPGGNSIYGGNLIEKMLGKCTFETDELRAVKASYSFEYFNLLSKVNAIKIISPNGVNPLTSEQRKTVINLAFNKNSITYQSIRKVLGMSDLERFNISYSNKDITETESKTKFIYLKCFHIFKKAYGDSYTFWSVEKKNQLAHVLTIHKNDEKIKAYLKEVGFDETEIAVALTLPTFTKTCNLSVKALDKIIPHLEEGLLYNEACQKAGYNFKRDEKIQSVFLPANANVASELADIKNPVVRRAVSQTIKLVNSIIRYCDASPVFVNVEIARELAKNFKDRKEIEKGQKENQAKNDRIMQRLREEFGLMNPTGQDLIKLKLWEEQDGVCPYSLQPIKIEKLFDVGYTDIDHIIPYSISFDDSYNNKVLVRSSENRQKGNRIPMQYLSEEKKNEFYLWVDNSNLRYKKKSNLLKETLTDDDLSGFKKRNLNDTQYISRFVLNFLKKYLLLSPNNTGRKDAIKSVNGAVTSYIRKRWGIKKIRENGDVHHAVDAVVIACVTQGMIKKISEYSKRRETEYVVTSSGEIYDGVDKRTGELINKFPMPYEYFRTELEILCSENPTGLLHRKPLPNYATDEQLSPIFVSRMPRHKVTGSAHKDTIRKQYFDGENNCSVSKVPLNKLKLNKDGEIENYFNPASDMLLYNALVERLKLFGGSGEKAFTEDFYKPKSDGTKGPLVKKVKLCEKSTLTVPVHKNTAIADNGSMVRIDVFFVDGEGYYLVPIYVADTVKKALPNKAIVAHKPYSEWKEMSDDNFIFSLYPSDVIKVVSKKEMKFSLVNKESTLSKNYITKEAFLYYKSCGIANATINVINHDNTYTIPSLGVKGLLSLEKYQVDLLGNLSKVNREKRMGFN